MNYDVIIIGAGPAGNITANYLAKLGLNVALIEKQRYPGFITHCAGGIIGSIFDRLKIKNYLYKHDVIKSEIKAIRFYAPNLDYVEFKFDRIIGYVIDRGKFDYYLSDLAVKNGADLFTNSTFKKLIINNYKEGVLIKIKTKEGYKELSSKIIVGADGIKSRVASEAGVKVRQNLIGYGFCYLFKNVKGLNENLMEVYFTKLTPGGYVWIFPINNNSANFGCGGLGKNNFYYKKVLNYYLYKYKPISDKFKKSIKSKFTGGIVPISNPPESFVKDCVIIIGDAGNQINLTTAEGIRISLISGMIAAFSIFKSITENIKLLKLYNYYFKSILGKEIFLSKIARDFFLKFDEKDYNLIVNSLKNINFEDIMKKKWIKVIKELIIKSPSILKLFRSKFKPLPLNFN